MFKVYECEYPSNGCDACVSKTEICMDFHNNDMTIREWIELFKTINYDCAKIGESVVPLTDWNYYATQIFNHFQSQDEEQSYESCEYMAKDIASRRLEYESR